MGGIITSEDVLAYGDLKEQRVNGNVLDILIASAEGFVQRYCRRTFVPYPALAANGADSNDPVTKTFVVARDQTIISIPDLRAATTVLLDGYALNTTSGYRMFDSYEPATEIMLQVPYGQAATGVPSLITGTLSINGRWGWNPIPGEIQHACLALVMRMWNERKAAWSDSVALPDGSVLSYFRMLPASVQGALDGYKKPHISFLPLMSA